MTTTERTPSPEQNDPETVKWFDGLTGRGSTSTEEIEGRVLREALLADDAPEHKLDWSEIVQRAQRDPSTFDTGSRVSTANQSAANQSWFKPLMALAASIAVVTVTITTLLPRAPDQEMRGANGRIAEWRTQEPERAAATLANELRQLGAAVVAQQQGAEVQLTISASGAQVSAINDRLNSLEAGLDANGRLILHVIPVTRP